MEDQNSTMQEIETDLTSESEYSEGSSASSLAGNHGPSAQEQCYELKIETQSNQDAGSLCSSDQTPLLQEVDTDIKSNSGKSEGSSFPQSIRDDVVPVIYYQPNINQGSPTPVQKLSSIVQPNISDTTTPVTEQEEAFQTQVLETSQEEVLWVG